MSTPETYPSERYFCEHPEACPAVLPDEMNADLEPPTSPDTIPSMLLADDIEDLLRRYVVLPQHAYLPVALWAIGTWFTPVFDTYGYLFFTSPLPRCGKSRAQEVLGLTCHKPWRGTGISEAALFRMLEGSPPPTLLLDECEGLGKARQTERAEALNALLNAGYRRGQTVPRCVPQGREFKVVYFPTYGPKCVAAIGKLPPTIMDRCLIIEMQRRAANEPVKRFLHSRAKAETAPIRNSLERDMAERLAEVKLAYSAIDDLPFLGDRDAETSAPLFAVCRVFCPAREQELQSALIRFCGAKAVIAEDESLNLRLLSDLKAVWPEDSENAFTTDLLERLKSIEDGPWGHDQNFNARRLSRMLAPFNVHPRNVRIDARVSKGYVLSELAQAWSRYTSPTSPEAVVSVTPLHGASIQAANDAGCSAVADRTATPEEGER